MSAVDDGAASLQRAIGEHDSELVQHGIDLDRPRRAARRREALTRDM
jgi:hypothetical protein